MDSEPLRYPSGEAVRLRDRVRYRGGFATVVCVTDGDKAEFASGYEDYSGYERGIVISDDDGSVTSISETDEQLVFVGRP